MSIKEEKQDKIRVFLIDDHPIVRDGVRAFLTSCGIDVVGEASDAPEALRKVKKIAPDVIVLDVNLPSMDGWEVAEGLRSVVPKSRIIAFSIHSSEEYVVRMAKSGARGYVMKSQPTSELLDAIREVFKGGRYFPAGMKEVVPAKKLKSAIKRSARRAAIRRPSSRPKDGRFKKPSPKK
ncbi:MAG: response regulator transcription factor [Elusimicrobiales bacterium]|nr:response regulator transcription factor [Elusimicrobiales bacterium]